MRNTFKIILTVGALSPFVSLWAQGDFMEGADPLGALMDDIKAASERSLEPESAYESPVVRPQVTVEEVVEPSTTRAVQKLVPQAKKEMPDFASLPRPHGELMAARVRLIEKVMDTSEPFFLPVGRAVEKHGITFYLRDCKRTYEKTSVGRIMKDRAFLDIVDADGAHFFSGWTYADAPGFHAPEHPNYDISLMSCEVVS